MRRSPAARCRAPPAPRRNDRTRSASADAGDPIPNRLDDRHRGVHLNVPRAARELLDGRQQPIAGGGRIGLAGRGEVEPDAANARLVHGIEGRGRRMLASITATALAREPELTHGVEGARVVRAVDARLHDRPRGPCAAPGAAHASPRSTPAPACRRDPAAKGIARRVTEDMGVTVARARRARRIAPASAAARRRLADCPASRRSDSGPLRPRRSRADLVGTTSRLHHLKMLFGSRTWTP